MAFSNLIRIFTLFILLVKMHLLIDISPNCSFSQSIQNNSRNKCDLAIKFCNNEEYSKARDIIKDILKTNPNYSYAHIVMGDIYKVSADNHWKNKRHPMFDDKLVYELAYMEYYAAIPDSQYSSIATKKMNMIKNYCRIMEEINNTPKKVCRPHSEYYEWIEKAIVKKDYIWLK